MILQKTQTKQFDDYLIKQKKIIDKQLLKILFNMRPKRMSNATYIESINHSVVTGGKRLRPIMTMAIYELFSKDTSKIVEPSCAVELIHTGSLMLDDLPSMDNAFTRRGVESGHSLFGESLTILSSAALWIEAYRILSTVDPRHVATVIHKTSECVGGKGLIQGQILDLASFNSVQSEKELEFCYKLKTSVLFQLAGTIGASLGGANPAELDIIDKFTTTFGLSYQIRDDIIDSVQTSEQAGKDTNIDSKNHKPNYVSLFGIEKSKTILKKHVSDAKKLLRTLHRDDAMLQSLCDRLMVL